MAAFAATSISMNEAKIKFAERLQDAMRRAGYEPRPAVLEREFNLRSWGRTVTLHGVRRWLRGETYPSEDKVLVLAEWLKVPPQYLRFGTDVDNRINEYEQRWQDLNYLERETIDAFLCLPASQRKIVREVIFAFSKVARQENPDEIPLSERVQPLRAARDGQDEDDAGDDA